MALTKKDYEQQGRIAANSGVGVCTLRLGTWQERAWTKGFDSERAALLGSRRKDDARLHEAARAKRSTIDIPALCTLLETSKDMGRRRHIEVLAEDYNEELQQPRRLRLYRAIGRTMERCGVRAPIPTMNPAV